MGYIYKMLNNKDEIIYIGKTSNINKRILSHKTEKKKNDWFNKEVTDIKVCQYSNRYELAIMEIYYIGKYKPKYNKEFKYKEDIPIKLKEKNFINIKELQSIIDLKADFKSTDFILKNINLDDLVIYEGGLNKIGEEDNSLSNNWYKNVGDETLYSLRKNLYTYFKNNTFTKSKDNCWTCPYDYFEKVKGKGYTRGFLHIESSKTYPNKKSVAFLHNIYNKSFPFKNDDDYSLNIMLNFIYRVYEGKELYLYIPSKRMREMFKNKITKKE